MSKHYIRLDSNNDIIKGFSTDFEQPIENDICINEDGERQFEINGIVNPLLVDTQGRYNYKFVAGAVVELTDEEKEALFPEPTPQPTEIELLKEQIKTMQGALDFIITNF